VGLALSRFDSREKRSLHPKAYDLRRIHPTMVGAEESIAIPSEGSIQRQMCAGGEARILGS
jgi:hypothetical protein